MNSNKIIFSEIFLRTNEPNIVDRNSIGKIQQYIGWLPPHTYTQDKKYYFCKTVVRTQTK